MPRPLLTAIVPARGGSKGLPGKNIRPLRGRPMIAYTVEEALKARSIGEVIVSTDDPDIAAVAQRYGAGCPFLRPADLARDDSLAVDTYLYTVDRLAQEQGRRVDALVVLQPTSPLRTAADIDGAAELFFEKDADSVVSYTREHHPISWHRHLDPDGRILPVPEERLENRQQLTPTYYPNGAVYVFSWSLLRQRRYYGPSSYAYVMPAERSVDVDSLDDFRYAEFLLELRDEKHPRLP
ncbi:MAG: acylneuraminate cytidylyltransferase family protein [Proteobacteria bacterium]|nr:acylneuraminate cytidylyltransferase family protein [Pseudomonadota bacterium]